MSHKYTLYTVGLLLLLSFESSLRPGQPSHACLWLQPIMVDYFLFSFGIPTKCSSPGHLFCLVQDMSLQMVPITWELGAIVLCLWHTILGHHTCIQSVYSLHHNAPWFGWHFSHSIFEQCHVLAAFILSGYQHSHQMR